MHATYRLHSIMYNVALFFVLLMQLPDIQPAVSWKRKKYR